MRKERVRWSERGETNSEDANIHESGSVLGEGD